MTLETELVAETVTAEPVAAIVAPARIDQHKVRLIEQALEELRPRLSADGGGCEFVDIDGDTVFVRLSGACVGCQMANLTVAGIRHRLSEKLGMRLRVVPVGKTGR